MSSLGKIIYKHIANNDKAEIRADRISAFLFLTGIVYFDMQRLMIYSGVDIVSDFNIKKELHHICYYLDLLEQGAADRNECSDHREQAEKRVSR